MIRKQITLLAIALLPILSIGRSADACPFCSAVSQTFSEEIEAMEVVATAEMKGDPPELPEPGIDLEDLPMATFSLQQFLKGEDLAKVGDTVEVTYFGPVEGIRHYLMMGADPPDLLWASPLGLSDTARDYILKLGDLAKDSSRLRFFQEYLEHPDEMLARDAYDEFARAPYSDVIALKPHMDRAQLAQWVQDMDIPVGRRKLYVTMLGVCGTEEDAAMLEEILRSDDKQKKGGLDALIACFLTLRGAEGLPLIEELFLNNTDAEYADTYSAVMALRFHGSETDVLTKAEILRALRWVLDRPDLADLVIPDLARWQDWSVIPQLVKLYEEADEQANWVRVPIVHYMGACPLPEGKAAMKKLEEIDPSAVKRATTFFPFDQFSDKQEGNDDSESDDSESDDSIPDDSIPDDSIPDDSDIEDLNE